MNNKKKHISAFIILSGVFLIDRVTKIFILKDHIHNISIIGCLLRINYIENTGVAFGMFKGYNLFFILFNTSLLVFLLYLRRKIKNNFSFYSIHLIIGGALGNIFDRIRYGYVIDFIDLKYFPAVFNMADFFITCGAVMLFLVNLREEKCNQ